MFSHLIYLLYICFKKGIKRIRINIRKLIILIIKQYFNEGNSSTKLILAFTIRNKQKKAYNAFIWNIFKRILF